VSYSRDQLRLPDLLTSERLRLRPVELADIDCLWQLDSDPEVMRYVGEPATDDSAHEQTMRDDIAGGERFRFFRMIQEFNNEAALGWVFLRPTEDGKWLELGYRLLPVAWGRGLVPEASRVLIDWAFNEWQAGDAMALIMPGNAKSKRVAEKLGMSRRGMTGDYYQLELEIWAVSARVSRNTP
jgi:RimJ/RimL family protein N-acetyltransferase